MLLSGNAISLVTQTYWLFLNMSCEEFREKSLLNSCAAVRLNSCAAEIWSKRVVGLYFSFKNEKHKKHFLLLVVILFSANFHCFPFILNYFTLSTYLGVFSLASTHNMFMYPSGTFYAVILSFEQNIGV